MIKIIAEIGCNHNGSKELAKKMVDRAKECGADAVKFQTFSADALISRYAPKAKYQEETTGTEDSQLEMTRKLELSREDFLELRAYAYSLGLEVFSTPFDMGSVDFLEECGQTMWKIPSGEVTNLPYLRKIARYQCDNKVIILSSGMATLDEMHTCVDILEREAGCKQDIVILHCNTEYPTPDCDVNISAINDLHREFPKLKIGFSDHSEGAVATDGAAMLDICMIEKHFTLDKNLPGPDHKASASPEELKELCVNVRRIEVMKGKGKKEVTHSERKNKIVARKSIVAKRNITQGEKFTEETITCKRPGNGISPMKWDEILGKVAEKDFQEDELIVHSEFEWQGDE